MLIYVYMLNIVYKPQRGLLYYVLYIRLYVFSIYSESSYPCGSIAVLLIYTCMRYTCFDSYTNDSLVKDQLGSYAYAHALYAQPLGI